MELAAIKKRCVAGGETVFVDPEPFG